MKIAQRTFIITGGASGLGLATAADLHAHGAHVALLDRTEAAPAAPAGARARFFRVDVTRTEEVARAVDAAAAWARECGAPLGGVVNAAGVGSIGKILDAHNAAASLDVFAATLAVNVVGTFDVTRRVCEHLARGAPEGADGERGVVVMVSSAAAFEGNPGQAAYAASKGAVNAMTLPLARDLARHGIKVNTIAPGAFETPLLVGTLTERTQRALERERVFPRRHGRAEEFAATVRWMVECAYVNGEVVRLSGAQRLASHL